MAKPDVSMTVLEYPTSVAQAIADVLDTARALVYEPPGSGAEEKYLALDRAVRRLESAKGSSQHDG